MKTAATSVRANPTAPRLRQRGWAGMLVVLVALAIVGWLAKDALKGYLNVGVKPTTTKAATPGERARAPGAVMGVDAFDPGAAPPSTGTAIDRARGVEDMVKQQAAERAARGDGTTR